MALSRDTQARDATEERKAHMWGRDRTGTRAAKMAVPTSPASLARSSGHECLPRRKPALYRQTEHTHTAARFHARMPTLTTNVSKVVSDLSLPPPSLRLFIRHRLLTPWLSAILAIRDASRISKLSSPSSSSPLLIFLATRTLTSRYTFVRNAYNTTLHRCTVRRVSLKMYGGYRRAESE